MKQNIESIIKTQGHENQFGIDVYEWFFNEFENNYLSKINGTQRNVNIINEYDDEAKQYILYQLSIINKEVSKELMNRLGIKEISIPEKYKKYIIG